MEYSLSKSEKKRQAKGIEQLAKELADLSEHSIKLLPCDPFLREELLKAKTLKGGARKRQIKYIAKELRSASTEPLLAFLEKQKGSRLKKAGEFHELERMRDAILTDVLHEARQAHDAGERLTENWQSSAVSAASQKFTALDVQAVKKSALRYAANRKPVHSREIFRLLKAAMERMQFHKPLQTEEANDT